jgi:hemerythrin-like domain-containing protein
MPYEGATPEQLQHPMVREFLNIHNMFRSQMEAILQFTNQLLSGEHPIDGLEAQSQVRTLIQAGVQYTQYLHFHHHHESSGLFPALAEQGLEGQIVKRLELEHDEIAALIDKFTASIHRLATHQPDTLTSDLRNLSNALQAHLAYEETHVCPMLIRFSRWPIQ